MKKSGKEITKYGDFVSLMRDMLNDQKQLIGIDPRDFHSAYKASPKHKIFLTEGETIDDVIPTALAYANAAAKLNLKSVIIKIQQSDERKLTVNEVERINEVICAFGAAIDVSWGVGITTPLPCKGIRLNMILGYKD